jgi:uncharacterized cupredoxin-like copper-binding protein
MRLSLLGRSAVAVAAAAATALGLYAFDGSARASEPEVLGPGLVTVDLGIHYSKFSFDELHVRKGTTVQFMVRNDDPIYHEFIVGDAAVHARHQHGTEKSHPPVPGEVTVKPEDVGTTFYDFDRAGKFEFACHLPGHYGYGMKGFVTVEE